VEVRVLSTAPKQKKLPLGSFFCFSDPRLEALTQGRAEESLEGIASAWPSPLSWHKFFMKLIIFLFLLNTTVQADELPVDNCIYAKGTCDYYLCREQEQPCGQNGYFIDFGYHYCTKYRDKTAKHLSHEGQLWLPDVALCLQNELGNIPVQNSCKSAAHQAIASHTACYINTGFCSLRWTDRFKIIQAALPELSNAHVRRAFKKVLRHCKNVAKQDF
jgi:hypothetical protein